MNCLGKIDCFAPKVRPPSPDDLGDIEAGAEGAEEPASPEPASPVPFEPYLEPRETDGLVVAAREPRTLATVARSTVNFSMFATMMFWRFTASVLLQSFVLFLRSLRVVHAIATGSSRALANGAAARPPPPPPAARRAAAASPALQQGDAGWVKEAQRRYSSPTNGDVEAAEAASGDVEAVD